LNSRPMRRHLAAIFWRAPSPEHHHKSDEFERAEEAGVILPVNNDLIIRREELLTDTRESLLVQLLASLTEQIDLKKIIGQHDKDDLIGDHREITGGKMGQVVKTLQLTIPLLGRGTQSQVYRVMIRKYFGNIGVNDYHICPLSISLRIFSPDPFAEIIFFKHVWISWHFLHIASFLSWWLPLRLLL
jgi:hypothetical protein